MDRQQWFEIHDQPWFPAFLRDLVTESLEAIWNANRTYHPIAGRLREAVRRSGANRVVDLCSGGGGPWEGLYDDVADGSALAVCLTDFYPSALVSGTNADARIAAWTQSVDARQVPEELRGFRTIFSSFHHFDPEAARAMLSDAFERREGIGVFGRDAPCVDTAGADGSSFPGISCRFGSKAVTVGSDFLELRGSGGAGGVMDRWSPFVFAQLFGQGSAGADDGAGSSKL
jgi:hypothetical protein